MGKKELKNTTNKLNRLEKIIGNFSLRSPQQQTKTGTFKTSEVIVLLFITLFISFVMGSIFTSKFTSNTGKKLDEHISEFIKNYEYITDNYNGKINKEELIDTAINSMLEKLDDNSMYIDNETDKNFNIRLKGSYSGIGIEVYDKEGQIIIHSVFKDSPADQAGLKPGDIITKVNKKSKDKLKSSDLADAIKNTKKGTITITYMRKDVEKTVDISVGNINLQSVTSKMYNQNDKKIGYISMSIFANNSYNQFKEKLTELEKENINSLIIDLRANSGGYLYVAEDIISLFLDSKHIIYQIQKKDKITTHYSSGNKNKDYKIIVLIDYNSASASEIVASSLKEQYGATLVGTTTYGKGTVQEMQDLKNGNKYKITTKNWLTSKGVWINGKGIKPDFEVKLNDAYFENPNEQNDNQLQFALEKAKQ